VVDAVTWRLTLVTQFTESVVLEDNETFVEGVLGCTRVAGAVISQPLECCWQIHASGRGLKFPFMYIASPLGRVGLGIGCARTLIAGSRKTPSRGFPKPAFLHGRRIQVRRTMHHQSYRPEAEAKVRNGSFLTPGEMSYE
jgi:hypothetical protein